MFCGFGIWLLLRCRISLYILLSLTNQVMTVYMLILHLWRNKTHFLLVSCNKTTIIFLFIAPVSACIGGANNKIWITVFILTFTNRCGTPVCSLSYFCTCWRSKINAIIALIALIIQDIIFIVHLTVFRHKSIVNDWDSTCYPWWRQKKPTRT